MPTSDELLQIQKAQWSAAASGWEKWDDWFDRNSRDLSEWLCQAAGAAPGKHVLDLACGSGHPAVMIAEKVAPDGRVTAADLSPEMVQVARRKAQRKNIRNIEVREMDAQALAFGDHGRRPGVLASAVLAFHKEGPWRKRKPLERKPESPPWPQSGARLNAADRRHAIRSSPQ